jgi:hypothetical protein
MGCILLAFNAVPTRVNLCHHVRHGLPEQNADRNRRWQHHLNPDPVGNGGSASTVPVMSLSTKDTEVVMRCVMRTVEQSSQVASSIRRRKVSSVD